MNEYKDLDDLIVITLRMRPRGFTDLSVCPSINEEMQRIAKLTNRKAFRILDGRLSALRKSGNIYTMNRKWHAS